MNTFPDQIRFCHPWRPYQKRILDAADAHVKDWHFHVVAAPGSGKTVLGLELLLRLDRPALVFAPSLGIRDQWVRRFCDLFLQQSEVPDWISIDLDQPKRLTVVTYQSLGASMKKEGEEPVLARLKAAGIETLVFDEAHHLRKFWWECLMAIKQGLIHPITISLTATPPYDVAQVEWNRYLALCGEVDEEISVAELVKERNLCPHQDYVYFCKPSDEEAAEVQAFQRRVSGFLKDLALDEEVITALHAWPPLQQPAEAIDTLTRHDEFALSVAIFLRYAHGVVPDEYLEVLGLEDVPLPELHVGWAEELLNGMLKDVPHFAEADPELQKRLRDQLRSIGALYQRRVLLHTTPHHAKLLRSSLSKLRSISEIVDIEYRDLKEGMRMVVLTDYICEHDLPSASRPDREVHRIGVVPIFEYLRKLNIRGLDLAVLTGKLVVLPAAAEGPLRDLASERGFDLARLELKPLWHDPRYVQVSLTGQDDSRLVEWVTELFEHGHVQFIVGTTALLGEGWDAPAINSLVLATVVGSYMSTNQIRGRAIRAWMRDPNKTANIWHLACLARTRVDGLHGEVSARLMDDLDLLERRFDTFTGLSATRLSIEDGLGRLGFSRYDFPKYNMDTWNAASAKHANNRFGMAKRWQKVFDHLSSLPGDRIFRPGEEVFVPRSRLIAKPFTRLLVKPRNLFSDWLRDSIQMRISRRCAGMLLEQLQDDGQLPKGAKVEVSRGVRDVLARVRNVSRRDEAVFTAAISEVYNPLQKPRYIIYMGKECYAVPQTFATNKQRAEAFHAAWRKQVGRAKLVYAHSEEGRTLLLQARQKYLATRHHDVVRSHKVVS